MFAYMLSLVKPVSGIGHMKSNWQTALAGGGSSPESLLEKYDHSYDRQMHLVGRPHHWRSAPTTDQGGTENIVFQLKAPL